MVTGAVIIYGVTERNPYALIGAFLVLAIALTVALREIEK